VAKGGRHVPPPGDPVRIDADDPGAGGIGDPADIVQESLAAISREDGFVRIEREGMEDRAP